MINFIHCVFGYQIHQNILYNYVNYVNYDIASIQVADTANTVVGLSFSRVLTAN